MTRTAVVLAVGVLVGLVSCGHHSDGRDADQPDANAKPSAMIRDDAHEKPEADYVTLEGTVIRKPWCKSLESWNAGGSEYYVLDVGDTLVRRSAKEGVILRPSERVPFEVFESYRDRCVRVKGQYVQAKAYTPSSEGEQCPMDHTGAPMARGSGFVAYEITVVEEAETMGVAEP